MIEFSQRLGVSVTKVNTNHQKPMSLRQQHVGDGFLRQAEAETIP